MIYVDRRRVAAPAVLDGAISKGGKELIKNTAKMAATPPEGPVFRAYKDATVRHQLRELFSSKCAYCEGKFEAFHPVDVEHFRPKAEVRYSRSSAPQSGYWWLASDWSNLYPSCIDCNRARFHDVAQGRTSMVHVKRGKENLFPLDPPLCSSHVPGCERTERPLLLDPCRDDPTQVLDWTEYGGVVPRTTVAGVDHPMARPTIECFGLDRADLVLLRRERAMLVRDSIERFKVAKERMGQYDKDSSFVVDLKNEVRKIKIYGRADEPFSAMSREIVRKLCKPLWKRLFG